jgi:hypothetical protein
MKQENFIQAILMARVCCQFQLAQTIYGKKHETKDNYGTVIA